MTIDERHRGQQSFDRKRRGRTRHARAWRRRACLRAILYIISRVWGIVGTSGDSFHFKDGISGSKGAGVIDVAEPNDIPASMSHHDDAAGTHGPLAISERNSGTLGDSFHFKDEIFGHKGSRPHRPRRCGFYPSVDQSLRRRCRNSRSVAISEGAPTTELSLPGQHSADHSVSFRIMRGALSLLMHRTI